MTQLYSKKVMKHFTHPKNVGEFKNPDGFGEIGNTSCGDVMKIGIKVSDGKIKDIKFKTFGCVAAIASTSALTELVKGKKISEAKKIKMKDVVEFIGGLPNIKLHCSSMAIGALKKAIKDYEKTKN